MYTIRDFDYSDGDYQSAATIRNHARPDSPASLADWNNRDQTRNPDFAFHRDLVVHGEQPVAYAEYGQDHTSFHPTKILLAHHRSS